MKISAGFVAVVFLIITEVIISILYTYSGTDALVWPNWLLFLIPPTLAILIWKFEWISQIIREWRREPERAFELADPDDLLDLLDKSEIGMRFRLRWWIPTDYTPGDVLLVADKLYRIQMHTYQGPKILICNARKGATPHFLSYYGPGGWAKLSSAKITSEMDYLRTLLPPRKLTALDLIQSGDIGPDAQAVVASNFMRNEGGLKA